MMMPAYGPVPFMLIFIITVGRGPALADSNEALVNAVTGAFTPVQISQLVASAAGGVGSRTDQETQSLDHLRQLLDVSDDVVLALLRIQDRPDILPAESAQTLVQSAIQYHAVTDRLTEITSEDPEGQRLLAQARAAMTAGHFNDTEALLQRLEDREVTFSNRPPNNVAGPASSASQHLIIAAQAGTVLGEIALMKLSYGEATGYFQTAQQRLALMAQKELEPGEAEPGTPAPTTAVDTATAHPTDTPSIAETQPPRPEPDVGPGQAGSVQPAPPIESDHSDASRQQNTATIDLITPATNQLAAVTTGAPRGAPEQPPGSRSAGAALAPDMVALLLRRGDALLGLGDVSAARLLYERAAAGGDGRGATGAGKTYDPVFLLGIGARGIQADPVAAANWYRRAIELGDRSAAERLTQMSQRIAR
jgi:TPR repeat protein